MNSTGSVTRFFKSKDKVKLLRENTKLQYNRKINKLID